jgi:hypothetical protein
LVDIKLLVSTQKYSKHLLKLAINGKIDASKLKKMLLVINKPKKTEKKTKGQSGLANPVGTWHRTMKTK